MEKRAVVRLLPREAQRAEAGMIHLPGGALGPDFLGGLLGERRLQALAVFVVVPHHLGLGMQKAWVDEPLDELGPTLGALWFRGWGLGSIGHA